MYDVQDVRTVSKTRDFLGNIDVVLNDVTSQVEIFIDDPAIPGGSIVNIRLSMAQSAALGRALTGVATVP